MAAFVKYSIFFAVLASAYAAPQYAAPYPAPYPAPYAVAPRYAYPGPPAIIAPHPHVVPVAVPHVHVVPHVDVRAASAAAPIVSQNFDSAPDGSYTFSYESADGSSRQESGSPKPAGNGYEPSVAVQGRYAYASPEGPVQVEYIADENGYQPSGPNVHPEIQKAVAAQVAQARAEGPIAPVPAAYHVHPAAYHVAPAHIHPAVYHGPAVYPAPYPAPYPTPAAVAYKA